LSPNRRILESEECVLESILDDMYRLAGILLDESVKSLRESDVRVAQHVIDQADQFNMLQHNMERQCVQTIALQQPVASDLRRLIADIFIAMELRHVVDHATAIAGIVLKFEQQPDERFVTLISNMAADCGAMLILSRQAYDEADEQLARSVAVMDDEVDMREKEFNEIVFQEMRTNPGSNMSCTYLLWVSHNLERIGDRISNIAERIVYLVSNETPELN